MIISIIWFLTFGYLCADHNALVFKYFAADEAQSLDAIFRNEVGAIDGMDYWKRTYPCFMSDHGTIAAAAELGKTRKEIMMQKCSDTFPLIPLDLITICLARTMRESNGARNHPRWPSSALNFRSTGTPTLPMRQTSLSCGSA